MNTFRHYLLRLHKMREDALRPELEKLGLGKGQPRILRFLEENGKANQKEISNSLLVDPACVSRMLESLARNNFVTQSENSASRREKLIEITGQGRQAFSRWKIIADEMDEICLSGFSEEERSLFLSYLAKSLDNLERHLGKEDSDA